jgi:hypothetical protein
VFKKFYTARCLWFTPVILATWKIEVRRIMVQAILSKKKKKDYLQNYQRIKG